MKGSTAESATEKRKMITVDYMCSDRVYYSALNNVLAYARDRKNWVTDYAISILIFVTV